MPSCEQPRLKNRAEAILKKVTKHCLVHDCARSNICIMKGCAEWLLEDMVSQTDDTLTHPTKLKIQLYGECVEAAWGREIVYLRRLVVNDNLPEAQSNVIWQIAVSMMYSIQHHDSVERAEHE